MVEHPQKTAALFAAAQGFRQLQIAPRGQIQLQKPPVDVEFQIAHVAQADLLQLAERPQQRARTAPHFFIFRKPEGFEGFSELLRDERRRGVRLKQLVRAEVGAAV